jgi:hypothetical protein
MEINTVEIIQAMLAPGLMISACGLLLLGMNNKYSIVVNRIRLLNDEKRNHLHRKNKPDYQHHEEVRFHSITSQLDKLRIRVLLVRNAVLSYSIAIAFFIIAGLFIGLQFIVENNNVYNFAIVSFVLGMIAVFVGVFFASNEVIKGYQIIKIEIKEVE